MDGQPCAVRVQQSEQGVIIQVDGRATMRESPAVRRFAEACVANGAKAMWLDLRQCSHLDSTFIGTMLCLHRFSKGKATFALLGPSPECQRLLFQIGLIDILPVADAEPQSSGTWTSLDNRQEDAGQLKSNMIQAHQELIKQGGGTAEKFKAVAACLEREGPAAV